jgi:ABC-type Zn uptake system ZnuABC Zn-binding protein ZnuA
VNRRLLPLLLPAALLPVLLVTGCFPGKSRAAAPVIATENFLADITRQVAGDRMEVRSLIPAGVDPHAYEPTPQDAAAVAGARLIVVNGAGLESFLSKLLQTAGQDRPVLEASHGLASRTAREGEVLEGGTIATGPSTDPDPHFWLDPVMVIRYVQNIRDELSRMDPAGEPTYGANADAYIKKLHELDAWITAESARIPPERRKLVTNHETFGYFADQYGFRIIGTVIPGVSSDAAPTARQIARLIDGLKKAGAPAVFLDMGANPQLGQQVAREAGIPVVTELFTHSLTDASGKAPSYLEMMRYDVNAIVSALAGGAS